MSAQRPSPESSGSYRWFCPIVTRWADNDLYGHINNVAYYGFFDSAANRFLIEEGGLDIHAGPVIGIVVESRCAYFRPLAFPEALRAGVRVDRLGNSSLTWGIAIFREGEELAAAQGQFVHVFVDRESYEPVRIPDELRQALSGIAAAASGR